MRLCQFSVLKLGGGEHRPITIETHKLSIYRSDVTTLVKNATFRCELTYILYTLVHLGFERVFECKDGSSEFEDLLLLEKADQISKKFNEAASNDKQGDNTEDEVEKEEEECLRLNQRLTGTDLPNSRLVIHCNHDSNLFLSSKLQFKVELNLYIELYYFPNRNKFPKLLARRTY